MRHRRYEPFRLCGNLRWIFDWDLVIRVEVTVVVHNWVVGWCVELIGLLRCMRIVVRSRIRLVLDELEVCRRACQYVIDDSGVWSEFSKLCHGSCLGSSGVISELG